MLVACERPLEPTPRSSLVHGRTAPASIAFGEHIAWRHCYTDWSTDAGVTCVLNVANGDGTVTSFGEGYAYNEPSWSPDATKIAVDGGTYILVLTVADGTFTYLDNGGTSHSPAWSPDGARIAFVSDRDGQPELYLMNATDGSNVTRVTNSVGFSGNPDWFPDGSRLAFDCEVESGNYDICAINADGTGFTRLTTDPAADFSPAVSPDGTRIAFATGIYASASDIAVMNADGSNVTRLTTTGNAGQPDWSPGGSRMSFTSFFSGACNDYCDDSFDTINADGSNVLPFAAGSQAAWRPGEESPPPSDDPPVAHASADCTNLTCGFRGYESTDDHQITHYVWNFGDGSPEIDNSGISYSYAAAGTYTVTLTVFDGAGQSSTATLNVTVPNHPPVAQFTASCTGLTCTFDSSASTDDDPITWRQWVFGDNSYVNNVVATSHTYAAAGTYEVTLVISDDVGRHSTATQNVTVTVPPPDQPPVAQFTSSCTNLTCAFESSNSSDDHGIASRSWTFGDGSTGGNVVAPNHAYAAGGTYQVTLTVTDNANQTNSVAHSVTVTPPDLPPVAQFTSSCTDLTCAFQSNTSSDDHSIASRSWTFGDGSSAGNVVAPSHAYAAGGTYQVTLTVTDDANQTNSVTHSVTVTAPPPPDLPPVARFSASCTGLTCSFASDASSDDYGITSRAWTFGDGGSAGNVVAPSHAYGVGGGTFQVTLTVTDNIGQTNSVTHSVTAVDQPPVARFTYSCTNNGTCTFDASTSSDDVGITSYTWKLGSQGTASGALVTFRFNGKASQAVTLTVKDGAGQTNSVTQTVTFK
jgi:PKD repeat protein